MKLYSISLCFYVLVIICQRQTTEFTFLGLVKYYCICSPSIHSSPILPPPPPPPPPFSPPLISPVVSVDIKHHVYVLTFATLSFKDKITPPPPPPPGVNTKTFAERSFSYAGPSVWNNLPQTLRHSDSTSSFKAALKTHLVPV